MIKKNFLPRKATKLIGLIFIFSTLSCSITKTTSSEKMVNSLDDYIASYKSYIFEDSLNVIMISTKFKDGKVKYIINDAPKSVFLGDLKKHSQNKNSYIFMGTYKNILCKINSDSLSTYQHIFNDLNKDIVDKANQAGIMNDKDGKNYFLDLSLSNWNPALIIIYNISDNTKEIILN